MQKSPLIYSFLLLLLASCATQPPVGVPEKISPPLSTEHRLWTAAYRVALNYPIRDLSEKDRFIESDWIEEGKYSRYRFFITMGHPTQSSPTEIIPEIIPEIIIEIQNQSRSSQIRPSKKSEWRWSAPSLDKEEKLKQAIYAEFQKNL